MKLSPTEALANAISNALFWETQQDRPNPGFIIQHMDEANREALGRLTSCEAKKIRFYDCTDLSRGARRTRYYREENQKLKEEFDRIIRTGR